MSTIVFDTFEAIPLSFSISLLLFLFLLSSSTTHPPLTLTHLCLNASSSRGICTVPSSPLLYSLSIALSFIPCFMKMGVKLVGDSKPIKPFTVEELAERLEAQKAFYDGVSIYLKQRGSQPLETSMFAHAKPSTRPAARFTGNYSRRPAPKPAAQSAGRFVKNQVCLYFSSIWISRT
jgi:hypothetical protein